MSSFNETLRRARIRQITLYSLSAISGVVVLSLVFIGLAISNGTRLEIVPPEAAEQADISVSNGVLVSGSLYSLFRVPVVHVTAPGFKSVTDSIPSSAIGSTHRIRLVPLPSGLALKTDHPHPEIRWLADQNPVHIGPFLDLEQEPGSVQITIDHPYFEITTVNLTLSRGEILTETIFLQPTTREITIDSRPSGADLTLNIIEDVLKTPVTLTIPTGETHITLSADSFQGVTDVIDVRRGEAAIERSYILNRHSGRLLVSGVPVGGTLTIDGLEQSVNLPLSVTAGEDHEVSYSKPGFITKVQTVEVAANSTRRIDFALEPAIGSIEIRSQPSADVSINGQPVGQTPYQTDLMTTPHVITIKKEGYRSVTRTIQPNRERTQSVSVTLVREKDARLKEAKSSYQTAVGGTVQLFKPNDQIVLGAARHEKGQRANEILRTVQLTRPFYAGLHEITQREFAQFLGQSPTQDPNEPVTSISWSDAARFCNWLSTKENLTPVYVLNGQTVTGFQPNADGYRLLSEAEWEWLARKAGKAERTVFTWGNETVLPPRVANIADESAKGSAKFYVPNYTDSFAGIAPVGRFAQEPSGVYDMAGNVSEWVHDFYSVVPSQGRMKNPLGPSSGSAHVVKGGSYRSGSLTTLRAAFREARNDGRADLGFRIGRYLYGGKDE